MKFNSQICTSREQSERFLALGLKKETADMYWVEKWGLKDGEVEPYFTGEYIVCVKQPNMWIDCQSTIPAWSLHRLIEMMPKYVKRGNIHYERTLFPESVCYYKELYKDCGDDLISFDYPNLYDRIIDAIEWLIKNGYFPKEYVQHSENTREEGR